MKKITLLLSALLALGACQKHYEFNTDFTLPTELDSPSAVSLDVTSTQTVVLSWNGGKAADGGLVLYEVLFDKEGGDFSSPVDVRKSDQGALPQLTLSHAELNTISRKAGIKPNESGTLIWTVKASKGGVSRILEGHGTIIITRGEGIDNMPTQLFVAGSAASEAGQEFRVAEEGVYVIVTRLKAGNLHFSSLKEGGDVFYATASGKLVEGEGDYTVSEAPATGLARITVNFNTLGLSMETIATEIHAQWEATHADFAVLEYQGDGVFSGEGEAVFLGPGRDGTPDWCSWVEERYSFIVNIDGNNVRWGSFEGGNAFTPTGEDSFYYIKEAPIADWDGLWKMDHALDLKMVRATVYTNKDNQFTHMVEQAGEIVYEQPTSAPAALYLSGTAAEADGQAFRKDGDKFIIYTKLNNGTLSFVDGDGVKYFLQGENDLYIGKRTSDVTASEEVSRITVDFASKKATFEKVGTSVRMIWGCNYDTVIELTYQGQGKFAGEGEVVFVDPAKSETNPPSWLSWVEERYYFIATVEGTEVCWGRLDSESAERPDGEVTETFYDMGEFAWDQWSHLWKMGSAFDGSTVSATINTNDNGHFKHSFVKQTADPFPPTTAPSALTLEGTAAEEAGQAFRKVEDGVFVIYTQLKAGALSFKGDGKTYFLGDSGLLQGEGSYAVTLDAPTVYRVTVNFKTTSVTLETVDKVDFVWGCNECSPFAMNYAGKGTWSGTGKVEFIEPGDPQFNRATWLTWEEERYRFLITLDGAADATECWGILDGVDKEYRPDDERFTAGDDFWKCGEFARGGQWDHLWKMATEMNGQTVTITVNTNKDGVMVHSVTK